MPRAVVELAGPPRMLPTLARAALRRGSGGDDLPEVRLRLSGQRADRERLSRYQRLCGFDIGDLLPHTYPHILGFPLQATLMARADFPLRMLGMVHVENTITARRPLGSEERLDISVHAEHLRGHRRGRVVDLVTEVTADGQAVWQGRSTYLARGTGDFEAASEPAPQLPDGPPTAIWRLPADVGRQYAAISGDINPIHLSALSAKALGFPRAIAHGMLIYARVLAALSTEASGPGTSRVWFRRPILLPGTVELVRAGTGGAETLWAGVRSTSRPERAHLALRFDAAPATG